MAKAAVQVPVRIFLEDKYVDVGTTTIPLDVSDLKIDTDGDRPLVFVEVLGRQVAE